MKITLIALFLLVASQLAAEQFRFRMEDGLKYRHKNTTRQNIYYNGRLFRTTDSMNKAVLEQLSTTNGFAEYRGKYHHYQDGGKGAWELGGVYDTRFLRNALGNMIISPEYLMPVIRNVPVFPEGEVTNGDSWEEDAEEIHEGLVTGAPGFQFPMKVLYTYRGKVRKGGIELGLLHFEYQVRYYPDDQSVMASFTGKSVSDYYWDFTESLPRRYEESYDFLARFANGETVEYNGVTEGEVERIRDLEDRANLIGRITNGPSTNGITLTNTSDAIVLSLGNILFDADSSALKPDAKAVLDRLAAALAQYPSLDTVVEGHTDSRGSEEWNLQLSGARAQAVTSYLGSKGVDVRRLSWKAFGRSAPVASNETAEGRQKNRRVDIRILTKE